MSPRFRRHKTKDCVSGDCQAHGKDRSPIPTARDVKDFLAEQHIPLLEWPPKGAHLNVIENVWGHLKTALAKKPLLFRNFGPVVGRSQERVGKEHVLSTRWYFDGLRCREWHFPAGRCPAARAFRSRAHCASACAASSANGPQKKSPQDDRCGTAQSRPCEERQLRFLYFADVSSGDNHVRCLKASQATLVGRRCLVGPNRYETLAQCRAACVRGGDEGAVHR
ncbi:hypothetical protein HPB52_022852 [Rhipicephalus sanguineus]|uniref:Tc1-like transposase DDE domain-containing protein n=1 Tax=Rhipicephalus sanguineus TaxID=34632 RepID=A0A9D4TBT3_RHISA|nr:hypothetical protein HPB52_022852 [Rhipicephalus sanguineus]